MPILNYFIFFGLLLIASAITICGFYLSARGHEKTHSDGTVTKHGNILKAWYFFWNQKKADDIIYVYDEMNATELKVLLDIVLRSHSISVAEVIGDIRFGCYGFKVDARVIKIIPEIEKNTGVNFTHADLPDSEYSVFLWPHQKEPNYIFPEWTRKMMANCITCHASVYGSICFWSFHLLCRQDLLRNYAYAVASPAMFWPMVFVTWIAYTFCLSFVSTYFYKKI